MWLTSHVAVAVVQAGGCSSDLTPSMGSSICCGCGLLRAKKQNKTKQNKTKTKTKKQGDVFGEVSCWPIV